MIHVDEFIAAMLHLRGDGMQMGQVFLVFTFFLPFRVCTFFTFIIVLVLFDSYIYYCVIVFVSVFSPGLKCLDLLV